MSHNMLKFDSFFNLLYFCNGFKCNSYFNLFYFVPDHLFPTSTCHALHQMYQLRLVPHVQQFHQLASTIDTKLPQASVSTCSSMSQATSSVPQFTTVTYHSSNSALFPVFQLTLTGQDSHSHNGNICRIPFINVLGWIGTNAQCQAPLQQWPVSVPVQWPNQLQLFHFKLPPPYPFNCHCNCNWSLHYDCCITLDWKSCFNFDNWTNGKRTTATETLVNLQTVTSTSTSDWEGGLPVPTTMVSTMIMTERCFQLLFTWHQLPLNPAKDHFSFRKSFSETATVTSTAIEKAVSVATETCQTTATVSVNASCASHYCSQQCPCSDNSDIDCDWSASDYFDSKEHADCHPSPQNNHINCQPVSVSTATATMTKVFSVQMACPLQEKTVTRIFTSNVPVISTSTIVPVITSKMIIPSSKCSSYDFRKVIGPTTSAPVNDI